MDYWVRKVQAAFHNQHDLAAHTIAEFRIQVKSLQKHKQSNPRPCSHAGCERRSDSLPYLIY